MCGLQRLKLSMACYFVGLFISAILMCQVLLKALYLNDDLPVEVQNNPLQPHTLHVVTDPIVLWWTPFTGDMGVVKQCGETKCYFTEDRRYREHPLMKVVMFYGSKFDLMDLPLPRNGMQVDWALLHEESPKNTPVLSHTKALSLFNYTATFSRLSHFPLTLQYLRNLQVLTDPKYFIPVRVKNQLLSRLAPILYVQSDCSTPLERDAYVMELMKYIPVDSYGACLQNRKLPPHLSNPIESMDSAAFYKFVARYKFTLAFENAVCEDYITEKLWRPLLVGSVPVYMGSPSVRDWLPRDNSAILTSDFKSPKDLAEYLLTVNSNNTLYETFLQHKLLSQSSAVTNRRLISALELRQWGIDDDVEKGNMVEHFQCYVCKRVWDRSGSSPPSTADSTHYNCPRPLSPLTGRENASNWWLDIWRTGKCEAEVLTHLIANNISMYTHDEFYNKLTTFMSANMC